MTFKDFRKEYHSVSLKELKSRIESHRREMMRFEEQRRKLMCIGIKDNPKQKELIKKFDEKFCREHAIKVVLAKLSNVCMICEGKKPFGTEICKECADNADDAVEMPLYDRHKDDPEFLARYLNLIFEHQNLSDKEKEEKIRKWKLDI